MNKEEHTSLGKKAGYFILAVLLPLLYNYYMIIYYTLIALFGINEHEAILSYIDSNPQFLDAIFSVLMLIFYLPFHFWALKQNKNFEKEHGIKKSKLGIKGILICIIIAMGISGLSGLWLMFADTYLSELSFVAKSMENFDTAFTMGTTYGAYFWDLISIVIVGPIVEEMIFRSFTYTALSKIKRGAFAIILSGLFFGIWHMLFVQSVYAALMGMLICLAYYYTKNMWYPILIHITNNFMSSLPPALNTDEIAVFINLLQLAFIIPMFVMFFVLYKERKRLDKESISVARGEV